VLDLSAAPVAALGPNDVEIDSFEPVHLLPAARRVEVLYRRYETVLDRSQCQTSLSESVIQDAGLEYRTFATQDDAAALAADDTAPVIRLTTAIDQEPHARQLGGRVKTLCSVPRSTDRFQLTKPAHYWQPGMVITVTAPWQGYESGRTCMIVGKDIDEGKNQHYLTVFG
jgi:hypothetical protein